MAESWRICMICTVRPIAHVLAGALRDLGHEPVALVAPRPDADDPPEPLRLTGASAPAGLDLLFARDKWSIERLLRAYEPDLTVCWGFPWKLPQGALDVARLGSINQHPALLPRHRGPIPFAWALRSGDAEWGFTWHRMDAELDTGNILSQGSVPIRDDDCDIAEFGPRLLQAAIALLPQALGGSRPAIPAIRSRRRARPGPATSRTTSTRASTGRSRRARIHDQVRAWHLTFGLSGLRAPIATLDDEEVVLLQTRLDRPRRRRPPGRVRRRPDLGRRERARLAGRPCRLARREHVDRRDRSRPDEAAVELGHSPDDSALLKRVTSSARRRDRLLAVVVGRQLELLAAEQRQHDPARLDRLRRARAPTCARPGSPRRSATEPEAPRSSTVPAPSAPGSSGGSRTDQADGHGRCRTLANSYMCSFSLSGRRKRPGSYAAMG